MEEEGATEMIFCFLRPIRFVVSFPVCLFRFWIFANVPFLLFVAHVGHNLVKLVFFCAMETPTGSARLPGLCSEKDERIACGLHRYI